MTIRLFDEDSHLREFTAVVTACERDGEKYKIALNRTAFFPEGGGQFGDTGWLTAAGGRTAAAATGACAAAAASADTSSADTAAMPAAGAAVPAAGAAARVTDTQIDAGGVIWHTSESPMLEGTAVCGKLDWEKRFRRMQEHSGEHIISGLVCSTFGCSNIGFHLGDTDVTCDYDYLLGEDDIREIERRANEAAAQDLPIICEYPDPALLPDMDYRSKLELIENVRIVTIPGVDVCACCAPHVSTTGEIGIIKIVGSEKSHGGTRLHLRTGLDALDDYNEKQENIQRIIDMTSARQFETADAVALLQKQIGELTHALSQASVRIAEAQIAALPQMTDGNIVLYTPGADTDTLRALANGGRSKCTGVFVALTDGSAGGPSKSGSAPASGGGSAHGSGGAQVSGSIPASGGGSAQGSSSMQIDGASKSPSAEPSYRYMITSRAIPLRQYAKMFNSALNGRGGGKDDMIQGAFQSDLTDIQSFFDNWAEFE